MRRSFGVAAVFAMGSLSGLFGASRAVAAIPPVVTNAFEGDDPVLGGVLVLSGTKLTAVKSWSIIRVSDNTDLGPVAIVFRNKSLVLLAIPDAVTNDTVTDYIVHGLYNGGDVFHPVSVKRGAAPFVPLAGGSMTGALGVSVGSDAALTGTTTSSDPSDPAIHGINAGSGYGIRGEGSALGIGGVYGTTKSATGVGVFGEHNEFAGTGTGVRGTSASTLGIGVMGDCNGVAGVFGTSDGGFGVAGVTKTGTAVRALVQSASSGLPLDVATFGTSVNLAVFRVGVANVARIDNTGKGYFNNGTQTGGADFAESVKVDRPVAEFEPGDVLVIDTRGVRRFGKSSAADSALVVGVYSTRPGVLGRPGDVAGARAGYLEEVPMAIVGIVPCKVCDEGGPVRVGDLLSTSSVPGYAKRAPANPKEGTLLGKALDSLEKGKGSIEVFLIQR
jgi:hypothetical protein